MLENIETKFVLENFKKVILQNEGDKATINLLISLCSEIIDCSRDKLIEILYKEGVIKTTKFNVKVFWEESAMLCIEADSMEEAMELAQDEPLPDRGEYVEDSFGIDDISAEEMMSLYN